MDLRGRAGYLLLDEEIVRGMLRNVLLNRKFVKVLRLRELFYCFKFSDSRH